MVYLDILKDYWWIGYLIGALIICVRFAILRFNEIRARYEADFARWIETDGKKPGSRATTNSQGLEIKPDRAGFWAEDYTGIILAGTLFWPGYVITKLFISFKNFCTGILENRFDRIEKQIIQNNKNRVLISPNPSIRALVKAHGIKKEETDDLEVHYLKDELQ